MKIALITIGSELLNGKIKDINTYNLSKLVQSYDFELVSSISIPDDEVQINKAIDFSLSNDVIIITGGLGPTEDDITKDVLIRKFGDQFIELENHNGVAKGLFFDQSTKVIATPGVPSEFQVMLKKEIINLLNLTSRKNNQVIFKTYTMSEWKIFNELCPHLWEKLEKYGEVSCLPVIQGVDIGVTLNDIAKENELIRAVQSTKLSDIIWNIGHESLEEVIINKARKKKFKIGFAESCTGGLLASKITDISGSSSVFYGSIVSYSNEVKVKSLGVSELTLKSHGAVSEEVAKEMATGALKRMNLDLAVATTGIAGPNGGSDEKPVGTVCVGVATKDKVISFKLQFKGNREILKERFAKAALYKMYEALK